MIRLIGAILVAGGTSAAGLGAVCRLSNRVRSISSMLAALELMRAEMQFNLSPMPDLMKTLSEKAPAPANRLFRMCLKEMKGLAEKPFSMIWDMAVKEYCESEQLSREASILNELGGVLGRYDSDSQARAIAYACRRLEIQLSEARMEKGKQGKVFGVLGVITGLAIVIVLI